MAKSNTGLLIGGVILLFALGGGLKLPETKRGSSQLTVRDTGSFFHGATETGNRPFPTYPGDTWTYEWTVYHKGQGGTFSAAMIVASADLIDSDADTLKLLSPQPGHAHFATFKVDDHGDEFALTLRNSITLSSDDFRYTNGAIVPTDSLLDVRFVVGPQKVSGDAASWYATKYDANTDSDVFRYVLQGASIRVRDTGVFIHGQGWARYSGGGPMVERPLGRQIITITR